MFVDECHATGFFGPTGRGTPEHFGVIDKIDVVNSTLGKALGGATGGYTTGRQEIVSLLRQRARPYLFSNSIAPAVVGASIEVQTRNPPTPSHSSRPHCGNHPRLRQVFNMLADGAAPVSQLQQRARQFRSDLRAAGFTVTGAESHPIVPVMLGDARLAAEFADELLKKGVYVIGFSYPVVPMGQARIRTQLSAAHSDEQIARARDAFIEVGKRKGLI